MRPILGGTVTLREQTSIEMRIQPFDIAVPEDDPFVHDLLDRKESIRVLTHLVRSFEGPCVLAIDAAWGNGKTTFLKIWRQHLINSSFSVVQFNAWETDFAGDPFLALCTELTDELETYTDTDLRSKIASTRECAKKIMRRAVPSLIRALTAGILDADSILESEAGNALASITEDRFAEYKSAKDSISEFRSSLNDIAKTVSQSRDGRPLIVMIDELDRCRPSYAVELLEVAKHLFSVNGIIFVLAVNRSELLHSIKALYGRNFDARGYLRRFIDIDFRLPEPDRKRFIETTFDRIQIDDYFRRTKDRSAHSDAQDMRYLLGAAFSDPTLSLRQIGQALHRFGLIFASLQSKFRSHAFMAAIIMIFRVVDEDLYYRFCDGKASDAEAVDALVKLLGEPVLSFGALRENIEATLILGAYEFSRSQESETITSPLLVRYQQIVHSAREEGRDQDQLVKHAAAVIRKVDDYSRDYAYRVGIGFKPAVQRIELLSSVLIDESAVDPN